MNLKKEHRNQISGGHPLHDEAKYFHSFDRRGAAIPSSMDLVYKSQPHEFFAHHEGEKISSAIVSLAL